MDIQNYFEKQLNTTNYWLSFAEAKNAALIVFNMTLIGMLVSTDDLIMIYKLIFSIPFVISIIISLCSFWPNIFEILKRKDACKVNVNNHFKGKDNCKTNKNLLFYGNVAKIDDAKEYIELVRTRYYSQVLMEDVETKINIDFANEIITNSKIAVKKYNMFKASLGIDIIMLIVAIVLLIIA